MIRTLLASPLRALLPANPSMEAAVDGIMRSPAFPSALKTMNRNYQANFVGMEPRTEDVAFIPASLTEGYIIYLHLQKEILGTGSGATLSGLQKLGMLWNFSSPRRMASAVGKMVEAGQIHHYAGPDRNDMRVRRLIPAPVMIERMKSVVLGVCEGLIDFGVDVDIASLREDNTKFAEFFLALPPLFQKGYNPIARSYELAFLAERVSGLALTSCILLNALETNGRLEAGDAIPFSAADFAKAHRVSITQVIVLLDELAQRRLVEYRRPESVVIVSERFVSARLGLDAAALALMKAGLESAFPNAYN